MCQTGQLTPPSFILGALKLTVTVPVEQGGRVNLNSWLCVANNKLPRVSRAL